ncbi:MAG: hypothetical protein ACM3RP_07955 [Chitinophagales bacterium]
MSLKFRLFVVLSAVAVLCAAAVPALATEGGPYTIRGVVLGVDGKPIAGWPLRLSPVRPNGDDDLGNVYYKIPNYDDHFTYTDSDGRFTMTGVMDLAQVETHKYRLWTGGSDTDAIRMRISPCIQVSTILDFTTATKSELYVILRAEARSAVRVTMKYADGTPFNGSVSVAILNGKKLQNRTAVFKDGSWGAPAIPAGDGREMGRILILKEASSAETFTRLLAEGKEANAETVKEAGVLLDKRVQFLPLQVATVELVLPNEAKATFAK